MSGHVFFRERWFGFDDGLYTGRPPARNPVARDDPSAVLKALPNATSTPELNIKMAEGEPFALLDETEGERPLHRCRRSDQPSTACASNTRTVSPRPPVEHHAGRRAAFEADNPRRWPASRTISAACCESLAPSWRPF